jgi:aspartyl-tRNA(Asn)/glutamyl-tRNA(Gln) amidotransferase subunit A
MARTVEELRWLDAAMSGQSSGAPERLVKSPLPTVIVPIGTLLEGLEPIVERAYYAALAALQAVGWLVEERAVQALDDVVALQATHGTLVSAEAALVHAKLLKPETARQVHWPVLRRLVLAAHMPASVRVVLLQARARLCLEWDRQVGRCAVVALPTTAITAPLLRPLLDDADHFADVNALALRNTMPLSMLNAPSVSMPLRRLGSVEGELAGVGLMLSSVSGHDVQLLAWASLADMTLQSGVKY